MKRLLILIPLLLLVACGSMSPSQQEAITTVMGTLLANGDITQAQYDMFLAAVNNDWQWLQQAGMTLLGAVGTYFGIQIRRGPAERAAKVERAKVQ